MIRKTPKYRLEWFGYGDIYSASADMRRFTAVDNQLDAALKIAAGEFGDFSGATGGILRGWEVFQSDDQLSDSSKRRNITIKAGNGIIPFILNKENSETGQTIREQHYIGINTTEDIIIENLGKSRRNTVYISLNQSLIDSITNNPESFIDFNETVEIIIRPESENDPVLSGAYRTTTPTTTYPIYDFTIDGKPFQGGEFSNKFNVFVNGKPFYSSFSVIGNSIRFSSPLHEEDVVTVRIDPKYSLILSEVETNESSVVLIDSSVRKSLLGPSGDSFIHQSLIEHIHNSDINEPSKILLTNRTSLINYASKGNNLSGFYYIFNKPTENDYGFNFSSGTYDVEVYINGKKSSDSFSWSENENSITLTFNNPLENSDTVQIRLIIKENYVQIEGKLSVTDEINFNIDAPKITSGIIKSDRIPAISHVGIYHKPLIPTNPSNSEIEYVHRTDTIDFIEFSPVYKNRSNARNAFDIFSQNKNDNSRGLIHACAGNTALYYDSEYIMSNDPDEYFVGWKVLDLNRSISSDFNEYDAPFKILPIKNPTLNNTNNWDRLFYVGSRFIWASEWSNISLTSSSEPIPTITEILNYSNDRNESQNIYLTGLKQDEILDAVGGAGPLNSDKTAFILSELDGEQRVYFYDFSPKLGKYSWFNLTGTAWTTASHISSIDVNDRPILFVGTSDGKIYFNPLGYGLLESRISSGSGVSVEFKPADVWATVPFKENDSILLVGGLATTLKFVSSVSGNQDNLHINFHSPVTTTFEGKSGSLYNSVVVTDWKEISNDLSGNVKKIIHALDYIWILTSDSVYRTTATINIDNILYFDTGDLDSSNLTLEYSSASELNDISLVNDTIIICGESEILGGTFDGISLSLSVLENSIYGETLNNILYPSNSIIVDSNISKNENTAYVCGKYGIFQTTDKGISWRIVNQIINNPEMEKNPYHIPVEKLEIVGISNFGTFKRLYVVKESPKYGYGYGYGYGVGYDYFDIFSFSSGAYGYGLSDLESVGGYGYGYGYETLNAIERIEENDWMAFPIESMNEISNKPLRILGSGFDTNFLAYIDVETADGYSPDESDIPVNSIVNIFRKIKPLVLSDGEPQKTYYDTVDPMDYTADHYRQSIFFDSRIDEDKEITVASRYKIYKTFDNINIQENINNVKLKFSGINIDKSDNQEISSLFTWSVDSDESISISSYLNIDDILRIDIREYTIQNIGQLDHIEIEDALSYEESGMPYKFEGIRNSNFFNILMSMQHLFKDAPTNIELIGTTTSLAKYTLEDTSTIFAPGSLVGRRIIVNTSANSVDYTIISNTTHEITISPQKMYEVFSNDADGSTTIFYFSKGVPVPGTIKININGSFVFNWVENTFDGDIVSVEFDSPPNNEDTIIVSYVDINDDVDLTSISSVGDNYKIMGESNSPYDNLKDIFLSLYDEDGIIDVDKSFIENNIFTENDGIGITSEISYSVYYDSISQYFFSGTNKGIWRRTNDSIIYDKTSYLIDTIDASGTVNPPSNLNSAYIRYDVDTKEWTVTWGGGVEFKDENNNLNSITVNSVAHNSSDENIVIAGTDVGIYRTMDGGSTTWQVVFDTTLDSRTSSSPVVKQIVFDDKYPWVVNAVIQNGVFRSTDYGNNWFKIASYDFDNLKFDASGAFGYNADTTDSRPSFIYGERTIQFKEIGEFGPFGSTADSIKVLDQSNVFGKIIADMSISSIATTKNDINTVFLGTKSRGVYKSTMFNTRSFYNSHVIMNQADSITNIKLSGDIGIGAFDNVQKTDSIKSGETINVSGTIGPYRYLYDATNNRTYIKVAIPGWKHIPLNAFEYIGKEIAVVGKNMLPTMKVLEIYERGFVPTSDQFIRDINGNFIGTKIYEFIFDGKLPFEFVNSGNEDSYEFFWYGPETSFGENNEILYGPLGSYNSFEIPLFTKMRGIIEKPKLFKFNPIVYIVKDDHFNPGINETLAIIDFDNISEIPSNYQSLFASTDDLLIDYYIGDIQSKIKYRIFGSRRLDGSESFPFYDASRIQIICRLEDGDENTFKNPVTNIDPYYIWRSYGYPEFHASTYTAIYDTDTSDNPTTGGDISLSNVVDTDDFTATGFNQSNILVQWAAGSGLSAASIVGKYIGSKLTDEKYLILDAADISSGNFFDALFDRVIIKIERYQSSKNKNVALYSDGIITSVGTNTITISKSNFSTNLLAGMSIYPSEDSNRSFRIISNTSDTITVDLNGINNIAVVGNAIRIGTILPTEIVNDIIINLSDDNDIFAATNMGVFRSTDGGINWISINGGLTKDVLTGLPMIEFSRLKIVDGYLFACAMNYANSVGGGVYTLDLSNQFGNWTIIGSSLNGLSPEEVSDISVYGNGSTFTVYAATHSDGVYIGSGIYGGSLSSWSWSREKFPEHNIKSIEIIDSTSTDYENIYIGTDGKGIYEKDKSDRDLWLRNIEYEDDSNEIKSSLWKTWDIFKYNDEIRVESLFKETRYGLNIYKQKIYSPINSPGVLNTFDWEFESETFNNNNETPYIMILDPMNSNSIVDKLFPTITDQSSVGNHKLRNFISIVTGNSLTFRYLDSSISTSKFEISDSISDILLSANVYENPFKHYPDRSSISVIKTDSNNRIYIGTDKNGIWRSISNGARFNIPEPGGSYATGSYSSTSYGHDFNVAKFSKNTDYEDSIINHTGAKIYYESDGLSTFSHIREKIWQYTIESGTDFYNEIDAKITGGDLSDVSDLSGGLFYITEKENDEVNGFNSNSSDGLWIFVIKNAEEISGDYVLTLTLGSSKFNSLNPKDTSNLSELKNWTDVDDVIITQWGASPPANPKCFILAYERYEDISSNLPKLETKNSLNGYDVSVFIRDISIGAISKASIACGVGGAYITLNLNESTAANVFWSELTKPNFVEQSDWDVTTTVFVDNGATYEVYVGTWGSGILKYESLTSEWTELNDGLSHKKIWSLFRSSDGNFYAGTEHGGIYTLSGSTWTREINGIARSKIFTWKVESVPVRKEDVGGLATYDYDTDNLISYSYGGGIAVSTDGGTSWRQSINGLDNLYVQDVSICSGLQNSNTVYAATSGGGIFKSTNIFDDNPSWEQCETDGLSKTLNIDEVEVGYDPNIVYAKAIINQTSNKDVPFSINAPISPSIAPNVLSEIFTGFFTNNSKSEFIENNKYKPIQPFTKGYVKSVIYRSEDGGQTWSTVYDKDPSNSTDYIYENRIFGMKIVPGKNDTIKFLSSYLIKNNDNFKFTQFTQFTTISEGEIESEKPFNLSGINGDGLNLLTNNYSSPYGSIFIDPVNTDNIYICMSTNRINEKRPNPIYKTTDGGSSWSYAISNPESSKGFGNSLEISTFEPSVVSQSIDYDTSSVSFQAKNLGSSKPKLYWPDIAEDLIKDPTSFINLDISDSNSTLDTYYSAGIAWCYKNEPTSGTEYHSDVRPLYLDGVSIKIDKDKDSFKTILFGGYGNYLMYKSQGPHSNQETTIILDENYNSVNELGTYAELSGMTSVRFLYENIASSSLLSYENSLVGLEASFNGGITKYRIAMHRVYYGENQAPENTATFISENPGVVEVELFLIGNVSKPAGSIIEIYPIETIFSNFNNKLMMSVNGGISWFHARNINFNNSEISIRGFIDNPDRLPSVNRSIFMLLSIGDYAKVYRGDIDDDRYSGGIIKNISWTDISSSISIKSDNLVDNGISYSEDENILFLTEKDKIRIMRANGTWETIFDNIQISHPVVVSENNSARAAFITNDSIYVSKTAFKEFDPIDESFNTNNTSIYNLSTYGLSGAFIKRLILSKYDEDEIIICVGNKLLKENVNALALTYTSNSDSNIISVKVDDLDGYKNPMFTFVGEDLIFESFNNVMFPYITKIKFAGGGTIQATDSLYLKVTKSSYDSVNDKTTISCENILSDVDPTDYINNVISIQLISRAIDESSISLFTSKVENIKNITSVSFDVVVSGDIEDIISANSIDFISKFLYVSLGRLSDFLPSSYTGQIYSNKVSDSSKLNGLWISHNFGGGFSRIQQASIGDNNYSPCTDAIVLSNGSIIAQFLNENKSIVVVNYKWIPSENFKYLSVDSTGNIWGMTDYGITNVSKNEDDKYVFNNFYYNNFRSGLITSDDKMYLFDENNKTFIIDTPKGIFDGRSALSPAPFDLKNVNVSIEDSNGVVWIGTQFNGLYAIYGSNIYNFKKENSNILGDSIKDILEDSENNIWVCLGSNGISKTNYNGLTSNIPSIYWTNFSTSENEISSSGLLGSINSIDEKSTMNYFANGTGILPNIDISWTNKSLLSARSLILRNDSSIVPNPSGTLIDFNPIDGTISSITETSISIDGISTSVWKITSASPIIIETDSLVGKKIVLDTQSTSNQYEIISNETNNFYIDKSSGDDFSSSVDKKYAIYESLSDSVSESVVMFVGDGEAINYIISDFNIINDSTYYYYLYSFKDGSTNYTFIDNISVSISSSKIYSSSSIEIICGGSDGIKRFDSSNQKFINSVNLGSEITNIFFDSQNIGWLSAGDKMFKIVGNEYTEVTKESLFGNEITRISDISKLSIGIVCEDSDGSIYIATNKGLIIRNSNGIFSPQIKNDSSIVFRNPDPVLSDWSPVLSIDNKFDISKFALTSSGSGIYTIDGRIFETSSDGLFWTENQTTSTSEPVRYISVTNDDNGDLLDVSFAMSSFISSFNNSDISTTSLTSIGNNMPYYYNSNIETDNGYPAHIKLVETAVGQMTVFAGLNNDNVVEDEKEILKITFTNDVDAFTSEIGPEEGLSTQSVYCFTELIDLSPAENVIYAGCKDNIVYYDNSSSSWKILAYSSASLDNGGYYAYTCLDSRNDDTAIEPETVPETNGSGRVIYATRTDLYGNERIGQESSIFSFRVGKPVERRVSVIELSIPFVESRYQQFMDAGFKFDYDYSKYRDNDKEYFKGLNTIQALVINKLIYSGHRGAIKFVNNNSKSILVGSFNNRLIEVSFTAEKKDTIQKYFMGVRNSDDFPVNERKNKTIFDLTVRPKNTWSVRFDGDVGYASTFNFGINTNHMLNIFSYASSTNNSTIFKSRDGGMIWCQISFGDNCPRSVLSDYRFGETGEIIASSMGGIDGEVGVFRSENGGKTWFDYSGDMPNVPVRSIEKINSYTYAGPIGFGVYRRADASAEYGYGYGFGRGLDYFDVFDLDGYYFGYGTYGFEETFVGEYGYGYGYEFSSSSWQQYLSRYPTLMGNNFGLWSINDIQRDNVIPSRIIIATENQGILESMDYGKTWKMDHNGLPSGKIHKIEMLRFNPSIVLAGVGNDGLYIKNSDTEYYEQVTNGLPSVGYVSDIVIDENFEEIFTQFKYDNSTNEDLLILRSVYNVPTTLPTNSTTYYVGDEIGNAEVVYIGNDDFSTTLFKDTSSKLKNGLPYYYRIFKVIGGNTYEEIDVVYGVSTTISRLSIVDSSASFVVDEFIGRMITISISEPNKKHFKIIGNDSTTIYLEKDSFRVANNGDATDSGRLLSGETYAIKSTISTIAISVNPIYVVFNYGGIGSVYKSEDNGLSWTLRNSGITASVNGITVRPTPQNTSVQSHQRSTVFAATDFGVFKSSDNAINWSLISTLDNSKSFKKIIVDDIDCRVIYAITKEGEIYRTTDEGENWESIEDTEYNVNDISHTSFFTNSIYAGTDGNGIMRLDDSVRDKIKVYIEADSRITDFDIDFLEIGDEYQTDTNSIFAKTIVRNNTVGGSREQIRFTVDDDTNFIKFQFTKNNSLFDVDDIFIGDQLENPKTNPFVLRSPVNNDIPSKINKIGSLSDGEIYAATNSGIYISTDNGDKWNKITSVVIPEEIFDAATVQIDEIALATNNGLWVSSEDREKFGIVESVGKSIRCVWESRFNNARYFYRGGEEGLKITIENDNTIIVYSGNVEDVSDDQGRFIKFGWGNIFQRNDGGWSNNTIRELERPIYAPRSFKGTAESFTGWDGALIIRKGPYSTYDKAQADANANNIFAPSSQVVYPNVSESIDLNKTVIFKSPSDASILEEIRDVNLSGFGEMGISFSPKIWMSGGNIVIGILRNRQRDNLAGTKQPSSWANTDPDFGPTPNAPIEDRVRPIIGDERDNLTESIENFADADSYGLDWVGKKAPDIMSNKYYIYRAYPFVMIPDSSVVGNFSDTAIPTFPRYRPAYGDFTDSYTYSVDISKFNGATTILCGISIENGNWVVGTDSGIFYSSESGRDVVKSNLDQIAGTSGFSVPAMIYTSAKIAIAAIVSENGTAVLVKSIDSPIGAIWELISGVTSLFSNNNVTRIFNFTEDANGIVYAATNAGVFQGSADGTNWQIIGNVGNMESTANSKALGQEFYIS